MSDSDVILVLDAGRRKRDWFRCSVAGGKISGFFRLARKDRGRLGSVNVISQRERAAFGKLARKLSETLNSSREVPRRVRFAFRRGTVSCASRGTLGRDQRRARRGAECGELPLRLAIFRSSSNFVRAEATRWLEFCRLLLRWGCVSVSRP